jgi:bifunctional NMN adenylyltransferase/nudix hydrolase
MTKNEGEMLKPDYGVIVGRFQVDELHDAHLELFRQVRARHTAVIVFVGVAPSGLTQDNPLDYPTRQKMIQAKFPEFLVLPLKDARTDEEWSKNLDRGISSVVDFGEVTLYGGRDCFASHYSGQYKPVELNLSVEFQHCNGTDIRKELSNKVIESSEFRAGMIYAACHRWPEVLPCVDIAIFNSYYTEILLGQKPGESLFRFIGGHYDQAYETFERTAKLEAWEEAHVDISNLQYVGSSEVSDWRYPAMDKSVVTVLFKAVVSNMGTTAGDDIESVKWFRFETLKETDLVSEHRPLFKLLQKDMEKAYATTAKV